MRWPFMLRATHDALMAAKDEALAVQTKWTDTWREAYRAQQDRHDAYVAEMAKATLPPPKPVIPVVTPRERDEADNAIDTAALFDPKRRRYLEKWVRERRAAGVEAGEIAQAILHPPATGYGEFEE